MKSSCRKLLKKTQMLSIGNGLAKKCDLGPMCTKKGVETTARHVEDALAKGARLLCGGKNLRAMNMRKVTFRAHHIG